MEPAAPNARDVRTHGLPLPPPVSRHLDAAAWAAWMEAALRDQPRRWAHVRAVWRRAAKLAQSPQTGLSAADRADLELAALLHDVGRAIDPDDNEPHAFVGARFLEDLGLHRVARLVAHHSGSRFEAEERGHSEHCRWTREDGAVADILTYLDMTTGPDGQAVTPAERRADIAVRYGAESFQVKAFDRIADEIERGRRTVSHWR